MKLTLFPSAARRPLLLAGVGLLFVAAAWGYLQWTHTRELEDKLRQLLLGWFGGETPSDEYRLGVLRGQRAQFHAYIVEHGQEADRAVRQDLDLPAIMAPSRDKLAVGLDSDSDAEALGDLIDARLNGFVPEGQDYCAKTVSIYRDGLGCFSTAEAEGLVFAMFYYRGEVLAPRGKDGPVFPAVAGSYPALWVPLFRALLPRLDRALKDLSDRPDDAVVTIRFDEGIRRLMQGLRDEHDAREQQARRQARRERYPWLKELDALFPAVCYRDGPEWSDSVAAYRAALHGHRSQLPEDPELRLEVAGKLIVLAKMLITGPKDAREAHRDEALEAIEQAVALGYDIKKLTHGLSRHVWEPLHQDPRFRVLLPEDQR